MPLPAFFDAPGAPQMTDAPPFFQMPPNAQTALRPPIDPGLTAPPAMPPTTQPGMQPPGLFSRLAAGFHGPAVDPLTSEWLSPEQRNYLASQGQAGLASSLLAASGPAPQGTQNFASRLGGALGSSQANWRQMQQEYLGRAIQSMQFGWEMQARQTLQNALADEGAPGAAGAPKSPAERAARLSRIAGKMEAAGPIGAEYAKEYHALAKATLEDAPLNAEQQTKMWKDAIAPATAQAHAWGQYKPLIGKTDRISIAQRAELAGPIFMPDKPATSIGAYQNPEVWDKVPVIGPIMSAALRLGRISPEDAQFLDRNVASEAQKGRAQADRTVARQRDLGESGALGRDWKGYYNPFEDVEGAGTPGAGAPQRRPARVPPLKP
jgi:hypothetical protein